MASIYKRGKYWRAQIRRQGYPTLSATFDTKAEALAWSVREEQRLERESPEAVVRRMQDASYTLKEALDRYAREIVTQKAQSTQKREQGIIRLLRGQVGDVALAAFDSAKLSTLVRNWGSTLSANSIRLNLALLSHLYNIARKEWGMTDLVNPVELVRKPKLPQGRDRRLRADEEARLLEACEARNPELADLVVLAIETAARQGELLAMTWQNLDLSNHTLRFPHTKNGDARVVALTARAEQALQRQRARLDQKGPVKPADRVWTYTPDGMRSAYEAAKRKAGIEGLTFHDLRHEGTSRLAERGVPLLMLQAQTGHRSMQMLRRYTHIAPDALVSSIRGND